MTDPEREALVEACVTAHRPPDPRGEIRFHPAWHDLDESGRLQAFDAALVQRKLEATLDGEGFSTTVRAVLARIEDNSR